MPLFFKHQQQRPRMPWGVVGAIGGAVVNNVMAPDGGGGGGQQQSSSSEPWKVAQPWMMQNILQGMQQQNQLTAQPFSAQQQQAYDNSYALNDYMRNLVPGLLEQIGGQQVGFDRANPTARPKAWNWSGLLSDTAPDLGQGSVLNARPAAAPAPAADDSAGKFMQQDYAVSGMNMTGQNPDGSLLGAGGYGSFKYGMPMPKAGTKEYRDMSEYFANGGLDPNNKYGRGGQYQDPNANPLAYLWTSGGGGYPGGGGIGDTGANAAAAASGNTAW